uniref:Pyrrolo-quinoline quinone n=1 Tax=Schlesneria paludicola TaxID=360056 RepID=A0A7C4LMW1_9PLAN
MDVAAAAEVPQATASAAAEWNQWRGPRRNGLVNGGTEWPDRLSPEVLQVAWRVPLGPSYSGPVATEAAVYVTETQDQKREVVRGIDRRTGKELWGTAWDGALSVPFFAKANGDWIRSTPVVDGEHLFVAGMRDVVACLDAGTGKLRWQTDCVKELGTALPAFGCVCSPLLDGPFVYIQAGAGFCKLDKHTGRIVWRTLADDGGMWGSAFSSPIFAEIDGQRQILVQTREKLAGVDPDTGRVLWSQPIPAFRGMNILTPTVLGNQVFTTAYGGKSHLFEFRPDASGFQVREVWTNKVTGYMSTPVVIDGHIYLHLQNQRFTCLEWATGKSKWTTEPFGKYWSLVAHKDRILALDERGELRLIRANPEKFELLDYRKVSEDPTWAHLAVSGEELWIRELHALTAWRWTREHLSVK